jgi:DNA-binding transcriptional ArsR family regulator
MISKEVFEMQAQLCQAMSNAARVEIVHVLQDGPQNVGSLAEVVGLGRANLSRHLAILRNIGLVTAQRQGQENYYQLANPKIVDICNLMRQVLSEQISHQVEVAKGL